MSDIAVLIPYYNHLDKLYKSLSSISNTEGVDVIIVDDGSSEKPDKGILTEKFIDISEIEILTHEINKGLSHALNTGLEYILKKGTYKYIARLDVGDECTEDRFKVQKSYLENNTDVYLIGSNAMIVDENGKELYVRKYPESYENIKRNMYVFSSFMHPTVMFRADALASVGSYPILVCQDYAFFFKFIRKYKAVNLQNVLVKYELNRHGITYNRYRKLQMDGLKVLWANFQFRYIRFIFIGTVKRIVCIILGPKIMMKLGTKLRLIGL
jgi:glycosyltransferase involved in cell wall biosynthesis